MNRFEIEPREVEPETLAIQESADLFDYGKIKDYALFVLHAAKRHKLIVVLVYALVFGATGALLWALPRTYHVETKLLGQRNQVISSLAVPSRAMPGEADAPARAAMETIKSRDSLLTLMDQTDLINHFYQHRSPAGVLKDWLLVKLGHAPSADDKRESVLGMLEQRLAVTPSWQSEGTVIIAVDWPDPKIAFKLVDAAQENFRTERHRTELSNIAEAISILEGYAANYRKEVEEAADALEAVRSQKAAHAGRPRPPARARQRPVVDPDLARLRSMIDGKARTLKELEDNHHRRVSELQARLADQEAIYAENHPIVMEGRQNLRTAAVEPPAIPALRKELDELKAEYAQRGGANEEVLAATPLAPEILQMQAKGREPESGEEYLKLYLLDQAVRKWTRTLDRIDSAKIEMDTAHAAFKYRYSVLKPPLVPNQPSKPSAVRVLGAGAIAALFTALFAVVAMDIWSGKVLELWQVERQLKLPVLSELPWP